MIALDPNATTTFCLPTHSNAPEGERPEFVARFLTAREWATAQRRIREAGDVEHDDIEKGVEHLVETLRPILVGWKRIRGRDGREFDEFEIDRLPDVLTLIELWDLVYASLDAIQLAETDLKKSASPSQS